MGLEQFPNAIKIGSTTSAADGNVSEMYLPGNIVTYATFLGTFYPDYTPTQRVGIIPDFEIHPTIAGIRSGKDEVMDFALNCELIGITEPVTAIETVSETTFYPNPAQDVINYDLVHPGSATMELYDMGGKKLQTFYANSSSGTLDISTLENGIYLIKIHLDEGILTKRVLKQ